MVVIGKTDSGKSTLVRFLHKKLGGCIVDSDVGQSDIGPPTTIGLSKDGETMSEGYFVGSTSPAGHFSKMIMGTKRMIEKGFPSIFVDTTGMVYGQRGRALKTQMVKSLNPDHLIILGNGKLDYFDVND
ncbi:hypothetical protein AKJ63_02175, partial [candidate division MSBL1 archaeon SCGC-AAA259D18]